MDFPHSSLERALFELACEKGVLRSRDLGARGLARAGLRRLTERGLLVSVGRGVYALAEAEASQHQTLIEVARRVPHGVICLLSALRFHEIGTQEPGRIWLCIEGHARAPITDVARLELVRQSGAAWEAGVETHALRVGEALVPVKITSPAKTVADCFKFRSRVGLDVALEALREALRERKVTYGELWQMAQVNRVSSVMRPYLEAFAAR